MTSKQMTYYRLYLKNYLQQQDDSRADDEDFIQVRSNKAMSSPSSFSVWATDSGKRATLAVVN